MKRHGPQRNYTPTPSGSVISAESDGWLLLEMGHECLWPQSRSHAQVNNCHQLRRKRGQLPMNRQTGKLGTRPLFDFHYFLTLDRCRHGGVRQPVYRRQACRRFCAASRSARWASQQEVLADLEIGCRKPKNRPEGRPLQTQKQIPHPHKARVRDDNMFRGCRDGVEPFEAEGKQAAALQNVYTLPRWGRACSTPTKRRQAAALQCGDTCHESRSNGSRRGPAPKLPVS